MMEQLDVGMMEHWKNEFGILQCWINGNNRLDDKIKNGSYPYKKPLSHHSIIPRFHD